MTKPLMTQQYEADWLSEVLEEVFAGLTRFEKEQCFPEAHKLISAQLIRERLAELNLNRRDFNANCEKCIENYKWQEAHLADLTKQLKEVEDE